MVDSETKRKNYRAIDLFAGIGGIRLGFERAFGERVDFVFTNEIDEYCCQTYEANFGENPQGDITKIKPKNIPNFDILLAGFPCQAFSIAGRRKGFEDTRGTLFYYIAKIIEDKQPTAFLLENVKHLVNHDQGRTFRVIKDVLEEDLEYNIHYKVLNSRNFGVPQNRPRIFIIGFKENLRFNFPEPPEIDVSLEDILDKKVDESYYLSQEYLNGLKKHRARHEAKGNGFGYMVIPREDVANTIVLGGMGKERNLVKDKVLDDCWQKEGDDLQLRNNEGIRKMTEREWARLQGFPESFTFPVSKTRTYRQLANSVTIPVIEALAGEMLKSLDKHIVDKKPVFTKEEKHAVELLLELYNRKEYTKTGQKNISTLEKFIEKYAIRIDNLDEILEILIKYQIITQINDTSVYFNEKLLDFGKKEEFKRFIYEVFYDKKPLKPTMEMYV
jgi:DNA (cytosine-5)-methyltransferase 1